MFERESKGERQLPVYQSDRNLREPQEGNPTQRPLALLAYPRLLPVCASSKASRPRMAVHNATSAYCEPTVAGSRNQNWLAVHCHDVETTHGRTWLFCGSLRKAHLVEWAGHHRAGVSANR